MRWLLLASAGCRGFHAEPSPQLATEVVERTFVDPSRPTPAIADLPGSDERVLQTWLWIGPAPSEDRPLVLLAHGNEGHPEKFDAFARTLAGAGMLVAAVRFPATALGSGAGNLGVQDLAAQPGDLDFVLGELVADADLSQRFDPERVVAIGHSLGGATVLGWTRFDLHPPLLGTILLSPAAPLTTLWGPSIDAAGPPTLLAHGMEDPLIGYPVSEELYADLDDPCWMLGIAGAGHSDPLEDQSDPALPTREALERAAIGFTRTLAWGDPGPLNAALITLADEGHDVRW